MSANCTNKDLIQAVKFEAGKIEHYASEYRIYDNEDEDAEDYNPDYYDSDAEWLESETLDCEFSIDSNGRYLGVRFALCLGGPGIVADSRNGAVYGAWGTDTFEWGLSRKAQDWLTERGQDLFDNLDI